MSMQHSGRTRLGYHLIITWRQLGPIVLVQKPSLRFFSWKRVLEGCWKGAGKDYGYGRPQSAYAVSPPHAGFVARKARLKKQL